MEAFSLGRLCLGLVERDEVQDGWLAFTRDESRRDLQRISGMQWISFDDLLSLPTHEVDGRDFGPTLQASEKPATRVEEFGTSRTAARRAMP